MNIILVGAGKIGTTVASQLQREGHNVTVVDKDAEALETVSSSFDVGSVLGRGENADVLDEAGVSGADLFIALTGSDETNLLCCLLAKKKGARNTISRVRQPEFREMIKLISDDLGLSMYVNPERSAANEIARLFEFPMAKRVESFCGGLIEMVSLELGPASPLCGRVVMDVFGRVKSALVCAVERGGDVFIPHGSFRFETGDVVTMISPARKTWESLNEIGAKKQLIKKVIIAGGGRISYYLADRLLTRRVRVQIIERSEKTAHLLTERLPGADVCVGDGTDQAFLEEQGIEQCDAFCCLTGIDEENILTSLFVSHVAPQIKTVTKINRQELIPIVRPLGIGSVVSTKQIAADRVVSYVRARQNGVGSGIVTLYQIVDGKAEAIEFEVTGESRTIGVPLKDLKLKDNVLLACIQRNGSVISPRGGDKILPGDSVIVVTTHTGFDILDDILKG